MIGLTPRQRFILAFIKEQILTNGLPPTRSEISEYCGFASINAATDHLRALEKKGYISLGSFKSRAIKVLSPSGGRNESI